MSGHFPSSLIDSRTQVATLQKPQVCSPQAPPLGLLTSSPTHLAGPSRGTQKNGVCPLKGQTGKGCGENIMICGFHHPLPSLLQQNIILWVARVVVGSGDLEAWSALGIQARRASWRRRSLLAVSFTWSITEHTSHAGFFRAPTEPPYISTHGGFCFSVHWTLCPNTVVLLLQHLPEGLSHAFTGCINPFVNYWHNKQFIYHSFQDHRKTTSSYLKPRWFRGSVAPLSEQWGRSYGKEGRGRILGCVSA